MNKLKLFLENFLIYGFGGVLSKMVPLIMVPIVTRLMPSSEYYGISDLSNTLVQFGSALAIMGMYDAMYRMFFENDDENYKKEVCSTTLLFTSFTSIIIFALMVLGRKIIAGYFFNDQKLSWLIYISAFAMLVSATNSIISAPTRMQNKRKIFLAANVVNPVLSYSIAVLLLLKGHYIVALPLAAAISGITVELSFFALNHTWFEIKRYNRNLLKPLLIIAVPLLPNFLIYWLFNSCDKLMITNMMGVGAAGIYSVGSKLGHASQLIYTAFSGGWQFFAFSTMKEDNQVKSNSMIFEYLGVISFCVASFVFAWSFLIFRILFTEQYQSGFIAAPYLFLAPLMQMLFQVAANQFLVVKKTWPNLLILSSGALINIILNYNLIPRSGIEGAAIATLAGYIISDIICVIVLCKIRLMTISMRFVTAALIMIIFMIIWRLYFSMNTLGGTIGAVCVMISVIFIYRNDIRKLILCFRK